MVIAFHSTVHDGGITLFLDALFGNLMVNPIRESPHAVVNLAKFNLRTGIVLDRCLEFLIEVTIVEENIGVVPPPVEVSLDRLERLDHAFQLLISSKDDEGGIGAGSLCNLIRLNGHTAGSKDFIMLFADFSVKRRRLVIAHTITN